ncbi:alkyl hydroperoxide reductase AhpD [Microbispora rosea subsp. aerata]|nr:carboxymuconolactone decarboxylase family protein [Microbispora rosea]GGO14819.1 alkyl hydroperoxide reductase AhpD [Microbispora rosea subsp. aerata]GIH55603.1 alkyl hydroperoxide reductase AhpD [Microbispora rosea subsp. aerata]GLJ86555.1 alkyl hydroperoxide reductase AhpD [Microbispora rosea subsp. aerata]
MATPYRYVTPVPRVAATGLVAEVYAQIARDFGMARMPLFVTLSPAPDVLAPTWAVLRESLLAGRAPRVAKEVVAAGVSYANKCPFCVDAHTVLLHATGEHRLAETVARGETPSDPEHARLFQWAVGTATAGHAPPGPPGHAAEHIGTALAFHFINRMVSSLLTDNLLPAGLQRFRLVRGLGGRVLAGTVRRTLPQGEALPLLRGLPRGRVPAWGVGTPVGAAFATLHAVAEEGAALLGGTAREAVMEVVAEWDGTRPPLSGWPSGPLEQVPPVERPAARLALLAALAPYRVTDAHVAAWREAGGGRSDADLVRLLAFGAITAVRRIEAALGVAAS